MKYIKTYEDISEPKYKVGDLVKLNDIWNLFPYVKITSVRKSLNNIYYYYISTFKDNDEEYELEVEEIWIVRYLTPQEIEQYNIKIDQTKYNI